MIDWLHTVDLGFGQDIVGNTFNDILACLPGSDRSERLSCLWSRIKEFYHTTRPASQLDQLTAPMIRIDGKSPKLRSKAGECRYLYPFALLLAKEFSTRSPHYASVYALLTHFMTVVRCVSEPVYNAAWAAANARKCCLLYAALEKTMLAEHDVYRWHVKPKMHLFLELIEYTCPERGSPAKFWVYADETWGGWVSETGMRRGGRKFASSTAQNLLQRFRICVKD